MLVFEERGKPEYPEKNLSEKGENQQQSQPKIKIKAEFPNNSKILKNEFNLTDVQLEQLFILPHTVAFEPYLKAFQYKILNSILYTNTKLYKIGFISDDRCSFCKLEPETMNHLFFNCRHSFFLEKKLSHFFSLTKEFYLLSMQDVLLGIISSSCPLLNIYYWLLRHIYGITEELKHCLLSKFISLRSKLNMK